MHHTFLYFMDFHLVIFYLNFSPVHVTCASHAFDPLPAEHLQSLYLLVVKTHISTHVPDINQWRKQAAELQENLLHNQEPLHKSHFYSRPHSQNYILN